MVNNTTTKKKKLKNIKEDLYEYYLWGSQPLVRVHMEHLDHNVLLKICRQVQAILGET